MSKKTTAGAEAVEQSSKIAFGAHGDSRGLDRLQACTRHTNAMTDAVGGWFYR